ncbi:hypothetical protein [Phenylobacterium sp.]|uniref:hypothetical protein n=1 Tax=Phenylobacterium sp. TaxID=1871053 RepID=UPI002F3ED667
MVWLMPVPISAVAEPLELTTLSSTEIVPLLVIVLDGLPDVSIPRTLDVIVPLLVMLTDPGPVAVTAVLGPPLIVPLFV